MYKIDYHFVDQDGGKAVYSVYQAANDGGVSDTDVVALATALKAISDCALVNTVVTQYDETDVGATGAGNPLGTAEDKARLVFRGADGSLHRVDIPCPDEAIFLDDGDTVNASNVGVAALISLLETNVKTRNGGAVTYLRGKRMRITRKREIVTDEGTAP